MERIHLPDALRRRCDDARRRGHRVGLVPTMGSLHDGHLSLVQHARERGATFIVLTIFVNPLQFGPDEDLNKYPRTVARDLAAAEAIGVHAAFVPDADVMYPEGFNSTVTVEGITTHLEGEHRKGHFEGVTTVVAKLFNLVGPCLAVFGRKDYQQWRVLSKMVEDLSMPIEILGAPIIRDTDGLALSSRNQYLDVNERARALSIRAGLRAAEETYAKGCRTAPEIAEVCRTCMAAEVDAIDYVTLSDPETLTPLLGRFEGSALLSVAAFVGATRLIDNTVLGDSSNS